jgi:hypothetical protein
MRIGGWRNSRIRIKRFGDGSNGAKWRFGGAMRFDGTIPEARKVATSRNFHGDRLELTLGIEIGLNTFAQFAHTCADHIINTRVIGLWPPKYVMTNVLFVDLLAAFFEGTPPDIEQDLSQPRSAPQLITLSDTLQ